MLFRFTSPQTHTVRVEPCPHVTLSLYIVAEMPSSSVSYNLQNGDGKGVPPLPDDRPATYWVQHTTSCIAQSNAPEDG
jgi:hypothetical protein